MWTKHRERISLTIGSDNDRTRIKLSQELSAFTKVTFACKWKIAEKIVFNDKSRWMFEC